MGRVTQPQAPKPLIHQRYNDVDFKRKHIELQDPLQEPSCDKPTFTCSHVTPASGGGAAADTEHPAHRTVWEGDSVSIPVFH